MITPLLAVVRRALRDRSRVGPSLLARACACLARPFLGASVRPINNNTVKCLWAPIINTRQCTPGTGRRLCATCRTTAHFLHEACGASGVKSIRFKPNHTKANRRDNSAWQLCPRVSHGMHLCILYCVGSCVCVCLRRHTTFMPDVLVFM